MNVDENLIRNVAALARLDPDGLDIPELTRHMREVIDYVEQLKELDVSGIAATAHGRPMPLPLRDDAARPGLTVDEALGGAPRRQGNFVVVPRVIEGGGAT